MSSQNNSKVYLIGGFSALGGFLFGYHTGVISGVATMTDFIKTFGDAESIRQGKLSSLINGAIVGALLFGCFLGSLIAGQASDRLSRKYSIILFSMIFIVSGALQVVSVGLPMLLVARVVAGVAVGALSLIVPIYQSEIATKEVRGRLVSLQQWAITIGLAVSFWINYATDTYLSPSFLAWRIPLGLQILPAIVLGVGIFFLPFSPRWLLSRGREAHAFNVLTEIRSNPASEIQEELNQIKIELVRERERETQSCLSFTDNSIRRRLILGMGIQILQQLTGINSIMYYAPEIFKQAGLADQKASLLATGINGCVNILATIPAILFIDKVGRRCLLIAGAVFMALSMFTIGGVMNAYGYQAVNETTRAAHIVISNKSASYTIIVFVYIFVAGFAFSWGPTPWIFCSEIFPLTMRATGTSITTAANWAANCVVSFIAPILLERIWFATYIIFGVLCVIMGILTFLFYPETKGIPLERMRETFHESIFAFAASKEETTPINDQNDTRA